MKSIIETFYDVFGKLDADTMASCYHDAIIFKDPAFGVLEKERATAMWHMLCESQKNKDFKILVSDIEANETSGSAHWEAFYVFSKTGRKIHNKINATFEFKDGLIIKHTDNFNLYVWAKQALGFKGMVIGRTHYFSHKLKSQTNYLLDRFIEKKELL